MPEIRLVTFDLDNTLWDTARVIGQAESAMNAWLDAAIPAYRRELDREAIMAIRAAVAAERPEIAHDVSALRREVLYRGMREIGLAEQRAQAYATIAFNVFYEARQQVRFFDRAVETLSELSRTYVLAALTNGNAEIRRIGLDRYFSFALTAADVGAGKPAPEMFQAALKRAGLPARRAVHVGDHPLDDVHGAASVGMHTIWLPRTSTAETELPTPPTATVSALWELPVTLERICSRDY